MQKFLIPVFTLLLTWQSIRLKAQEFTHPGVLNSLDELLFIKQKVQEGAQPWKLAFDKLKASPYASLSYRAVPYENVECGSFNNPNIGCNEMVEDGMAVYCHAMLWFMTNDQRYANKAIEILNAWSSKYVQNTASNARLVVSWAAPWYVNGAEILRYSNAGWNENDIAQFNTMLDKFLPYVTDETMPGNNWIQSAIEAHMAIAVFKDNRGMFNQAVERWKFRVTTYIYQRSDGAKPINGPGKTDSQTASVWRSSAASTSYIDGMAMETCRDLGHLGLGFHSMMYAAEIAWQQGVDLFTPEVKRLTDFMELHGSWMTGAVAVPSNICEGTVLAKLNDNVGIKPPNGGGEDVWEIAYNHLHDRLFQSLPYTKKMIENNRPEDISRWVKKMETLTHAERSFYSPDLKVIIENPDTNYLVVPSNYTLSVDANIQITNNNFVSANLFINEDSVRSITEVPFEWGSPNSAYVDELNNLNPGTYEIRVVAYDKNGDKSTDKFTLIVKAPKGPYLGVAATIPGIIEAENFDVGGEGAAYYDFEAENRGGAYRNEGVDITYIAPNEFAVGYIVNNEWLEYTVDIAEDGYYDFGFRYSTLRLTGNVSVELAGEVLFSGFQLPNTRRGVDYYTTIVKPEVWMKKGINTLRLNFLTDGYNLDKIDISKTIHQSVSHVAVNSEFLYPNPTTSLLHLRQSVKWELYSISGKLLQNGEGRQIDLTQMFSGIYFVVIEGHYCKVIKN